MILTQAYTIASTIVADWQLPPAPLFFGESPRQHKGMGQEFWQYRPYSQGDSTTRIDWRASAKNDSVIIREQEHSTPAVVWIGVNPSTSMDFADKRDKALLFALVYAALAIKQGYWLSIQGMPARGYQHLNQVLPLLTGNIRLYAASMQVYITDGLEDLETLRGLLVSAPAPYQQLVHAYHDAEETLPFHGLYALNDGNTVRTVIADSALRQQYHAAFQQRIVDLQAVCADTRWTYKGWRTDTAMTVTV